MASRRERSSDVSSRHCSVALLLIDVINRFEFDGSEALLRTARPAADAIARLKARAVAARIPVIYVNDNFGRWRSNFQAIVSHCRAADAPPGARHIVGQLVPTPEDFFVLKPHNSGFYGSVLETLLRHLGARTLVLAGFAADNCVLFTAHDAYLREFRLVVPRDCVASETGARQRQALSVLKETMKADVRDSSQIRFAALRGVSKRRSTG